MKKILILGASGSIGTQTLEVIFEKENRFSLVGISVGDNIDFLAVFLKNAAKVHYFYLKSETEAKKLSKKYPDKEFFFGEKGLLELIEKSDADVVVNALSGFAGFLPSIKTLELNKILLLANKESLVVGGELIYRLLNEGYGKLYPIDSEHVAIAKCLRNNPNKEIETIFLTASGGPFFGKTKEELKTVTPKDALNHPTWKMGNKITIDSATLMNKAFEIVEASYLFGIDPSKIKVKVDRNSYVHSFVKFKDGTYALQVGPTSMKDPIRYALNLGEPFDGISFKDVEINTQDNYKFYEVDEENFPLLRLGYLMSAKKDTTGCIINAANETAVSNFLKNNIKFIEIEKIIDKIIATHATEEVSTVKQLVELDIAIRNDTNRLIQEGKIGD